MFSSLQKAGRDLDNSRRCWSVLVGEDVKVIVGDLGESRRCSVIVKEGDSDDEVIDILRRRERSSDANILSKHRRFMQGMNT